NHFRVPEPEIFEGRKFERPLWITLGIGLFCLLIVLLVGFVGHEGSALRRQFVFSWLFAFIYFFTILIGCFFWILVHHSTDSGWGIVVRRQMENLASLLPWMIPFFLPLFFFRRDIWEWIGAQQNLAAEPALKAKLGYFEFHLGGIVVPFFWLRSVLYLAFFSIAALYFRRTSVRQDSDGDPKWSIQMRGVSFPSILLFVACTTFLAFDWLASVDFHWASTMWGVYIFAGAAGAAMALLILVVLAIKRAGYLQFVNEEHNHMMGKLLLTFTIFWGYIGFSQYMLMWYANIPEETEWFIRRNIESWNALSTFMVVGRFFIPFLYLLFYYTKRDARFLVPISIWVLFMHAIDTYVTVMPFVHPAGVQLSILDILAWLAIGLPLVFIFVRRLGSASLFPSRDPRLLESIRVAN
ncbi:MAG: hypothetical protein JO076_06560, partial [Verrucomicrobia bacterium]|nr:hypothetical protein [Verrucomicrobiota bacterium]